MKSTAEALHLSVVQLIKNLRASGRSAYFWTFTFEDAIPPKEAARRWNRFSTAIKRKYPSLQGVRVFEWHPGHVGEIDEWGVRTNHSHGLHVHLVANLWLDVTVVRKIAKKAGFGRIHVKIIDDVSNPDRIACYVAKYLRKGLRQRIECLRGMRLWSTWGNFEGCRCKDVVKSTPFSWFWGLVKRVYSFDTFPHVSGHQSVTILRLLAADFRAAFAPGSNYRAQRYHCMRSIRSIFDFMPLEVQQLLAQAVDYQSPICTTQFF